MENKRRITSEKATGAKFFKKLHTVASKSFYFDTLLGLSEVGRIIYTTFIVLLVGFHVPDFFEISEMTCRTFCILRGNWHVPFLLFSPDNLAYGATCIGLLVST